jgi:hypothetical protein
LWIDSENDRVVIGKELELVADCAKLLGASRRVVTRIEDKHDILPRFELFQRDQNPVLIPEGESRRLVADA